MFLKPLMVEADYNETDMLKRELEALPSPDPKSADIFSEFTPEKVSREPAQEESPSFELPREAIVAGIPMLVGALMGRPGIGAKGAGKALLSDMDRQYEREKLQFKTNREAKKSGTLYKYKDPSSGLAKFGSYDDAHGNEPMYSTGSSSLEDQINRRKAAEEVKTGAYKEKADYKEEKNIAQMEREGKVTTGAFNPSQKKAADSAVKDFDSKIKKNEESMRNLEDAINSLGKGEFGDKIGFMRVVKSVEDKLSDRDREFYLSFINRLSQVREQARRFKGKGINPELVKQAKSVLRETIDTGRGFNDFYAKRFATNLNKIHGVDMEAAKGLFSSYSPNVTAKAEKAEEERVGVISPDGRSGSIPAEDLDQALKEGYRRVE